MRKTFFTLWNFFTTPAAELKGIQRKQSGWLAGMLFAFMGVILIVESILIIKAVFFTKIFPFRLFLPVLSLFILIPVYLSSRTKFFQRTVWLSILTLTALIIMAVMVLPVEDTFALTFLFIIPIILIMLYLRFRTTILALLSVNLLIIFLSWIKNDQHPSKNLLIYLIIFNIIIITLLLTALYRNTLDTTRFLQIQKEQERYRRLIEASSDAIIQVTPQMEVIFANAAYYLSVGYTPEDDQNNGLKKVTETDLYAFQAVEEHLNKFGTAQLEYSVIHNNGEILHRQANYSILFDEDKNPDSYTAIIRDITESKKLENKLEFIAMHDQLTGLPNRSLLMDRLYHAVEQTKRTDQKIAILFLDLDNFKSINDTLGHPEGDLFLQVTANRLEKNLRSCDTVGRWSGDEFVVILENLIQIDQALKVARKIADFIGQPYERGGQLFQVTASIGICMSDITTDPGKLIKNADQALYQSKREGKNRISIFSD